MAITKVTKSRKGIAPASAANSAPPQQFALPPLVASPKPQPLSSYFTITKPPPLSDVEKDTVDTMFHQNPGMQQPRIPPGSPLAGLLPPAKEQYKHRDKDFTFITYTDGNTKIYDNSNGKNISPYDWWVRSKAKAAKAKQRAQAATNPSAPVQKQKPAGMSDFDWDTRAYGKPAVRDMVNGVTYAQYHNKDGSLSLPVFYGGDADKQSGLYGNHLPSGDTRVNDIAGELAWNEYRSIIGNPRYKNDPVAQHRANQIRNSQPFKDYVKRRTQSNYQAAKADFASGTKPDPTAGNFIPNSMWGYMPEAASEGARSLGKTLNQTRLRAGNFAKRTSQNWNDAVDNDVNEIHNWEVTHLVPKPILDAANRNTTPSIGAPNPWQKFIQNPGGIAVGDAAKIAGGSIPSAVGIIGARNKDEFINDATGMFGPAPIRVGQGIAGVINLANGNLPGARTAFNEAGKFFTQDFPTSPIGSTLSVLPFKSGIDVIDRSLNRDRAYNSPSSDFRDTNYASTDPTKPTTIKQAGKPKSETNPAASVYSNVGATGNKPAGRSVTQKYVPIQPDPRGAPAIKTLNGSEIKTPPSNSPPPTIPKQPSVSTPKAPAKAGAFSVGTGNTDTPLVRSTVERAYRNDLGDSGAKAFTKNLDRYDPSGTVTRKLVTGEPLTPNDRLVISRAYHDSLPMDNLKPPAPEVDNAINNIVRNYSIFSRRMPAGDAFKGALTNTIGADITDNLIVRIAADPTAPLAKTTENIIFGRQLTPFDKYVLGHHIESIAKANDPIIASAIASRAEKAAVGIRSKQNIIKSTAIPSASKTTQAKSSAITDAVQQKEKILPLTLPDNATHGDIHNVDTHSRANSTSYPDNNAIVTTNGQILQFSKQNKLDIKHFDEYMHNVSKDQYIDANGNAYSAYMNLPQCIRDSAAIRKFIKYTDGVKNSAIKHATSRNINFFYVDDLNTNTRTKKIGISGNPKEVGDIEKRFENNGVLQSAPYDENSLQWFKFKPELDNGNIKDTCGEWKFIQWLMKKYRTPKDIDMNVWFYSDKIPCKEVCENLLEEFKYFVNNNGGRFDYKYDYDHAFKSKYKK